MNTIVLGSNHNNTLGLVWSLGEAGHKITLLLYESACNYVKASKYVDKTYLITHDDDVIALLQEIAKGMREKPVVFVTNDVDATLLNKHCYELMPFCFFEGGRSDGSINMYRDKENEERLAKECGFLVPQTIVINSPEKLNNVSLEYPVFIKANSSVLGWKTAMRKCDSHGVVVSFVKSLSNEYYPLLVQEYIKKEYEIMILGCSLYGGKKVICPVANRKIRHYPPETGGGSWSYSLEVSKNQELQQLVKNIEQYMMTIEYTGNFSAEFLYHDGKYYFLEVNLRNDGTSWLSTCSGFNLPDMVARSFVNENVGIEGNKFHQMHYMNIFWDIAYLRDGTLNLKQWLKQFNKHTCYSIYNTKDKKPFFKYLSAMFLDYFRK